MVHAPDSDVMLKNWGFLGAMKAGETLEYQLTPSSHELHKEASPSQRRAYTKLSAVLYWANRYFAPKMSFALRARAPKGNEPYAVGVIYCTHSDGKSIPAPKASSNRIIEPRGPQKNKPRRKKTAKRAPLLPPQPLPGPPPGTIHAQPPHLRTVSNSSLLQLAKLVAAHANGAVIEHMVGRRWFAYTESEPDWTLPIARLRIQPPGQKELFVVYDRTGTKITAFADTLEKLPEHDASLRRHYVEVAEDEDDDQ